MIKMELTTITENNVDTGIEQEQGYGSEEIESECPYWDLELKYGKVAGKSRSTYAVRVTSTLGKCETGIYTYRDFMHESWVREEMDDFGYCPTDVFEQLQRYAEYLKMNNQQADEENMDAFLAGNSNLIEDVKNRVLDYVINNSESIAYKTKRDYDMHKNIGAWLDAELQRKQYNGVVLALVNSKLKDIWNLTSTTEIGNIKAQLVAEGFLINKDVKDITLSPGNEKKCSLFRISPEDVEAAVAAEEKPVEVKADNVVKLPCTDTACRA